MSSNFVRDYYVLPDQLQLQLKHRDISRELQCGYRSKICQSMRATKLDGTLHKLCEFHRRKANSSQRRLQRRRQLHKQQQAAMLSAPVNESDCPIVKTEFPSPSGYPVTYSSIDDRPGSTSFDLSFTELAVLEEALRYGSSGVLLTETPLLSEFELPSTASTDLFNSFSFAL